MPGSAPRVLAGYRALSLGGYGTPFDLATLKNKQEVRSGAVDLSNITQVRIVDIAGVGDDSDSFFRPIFDPAGTGDSGGFDLGGVAAINQADPAITQVNATLAAADTANVRAYVSSGSLNEVSAYVEWTTNPDFSDTFIRGGQVVRQSTGATAVTM